MQWRSSYFAGMGGANSRTGVSLMVQELGGIPVPMACSVANVAAKLNEQGEFHNPDSKDSIATVKFLEKVINHTAWYANALSSYRNSHGELK